MTIRCSCCNQPIKNNIAVNIKVDDNHELFICPSCIKDMHNYIDERLKSFNAYLNKQFKKIQESYDAEVVSLMSLYDEYIELVQNTVSNTESIAYSDAKKALSKMTPYGEEETFKLFKLASTSIIDQIYEDTDYKDITLSELNIKFKDHFSVHLAEISKGVEEAAKKLKSTLNVEDMYNEDEDEDDDEDFVKIIPDEINTPSKIKAILDKSIIGQEKAQKILSVGVYNHYKRIEQGKTNIKKSNILTVGPTGSGKTLLAQKIAEILNVPFTIFDATSLTATGYVGNDVEDMLIKLIDAAEGDIDWAEYGIIYIDEIDKLARVDNISGRDVSGEGVQQALLKIVEGNEITINTRSAQNPHGMPITINTENILFIGGGAFENITMTEQTEKLGMGFNSVAVEDTIDKNSVDSKALIKYGRLIPELVGRFPIVATLKELTQDDLRRILIEPEDSIVKQYQELLSIDNVELDFTSAALDLIAKKAFENKTGARGLKSIIEDNMLDIMYDLPDVADVTCVQVGVKNNNLEFRKKVKK